MVVQNPQHPYTRGLLSCRPVLGLKKNRLNTVADFESGLSGNLDSEFTESKNDSAQILLEVKNLVKKFHIFFLN